MEDFIMSESDKKDTGIKLYTLDDDVFLQMEHFGSVIYRKRPFDFSELDHFGTLICSLIKENHASINMLATLLAQSYRKQKEEVKEDLNEFLYNLKSRNFVKTTSGNEMNIPRKSLDNLKETLEEQWSRLPHTKFYARPLQFHWEITHQCNMRCIHCYASSKKNSQDFADTIDWERSLELLRTMRDMGVVQINFLGGEPTTEKKFLKLLEKAVEYNMDVTFPTNGLLLNREINDQLKKLGLNHLTISLDSPNPHTFEKFRGVKDVFSKVTDNIALAKEMGMTVIVNSVLTRLNHKDFPDLIDLLVDLNVDVLKIIDEFPVGRGMSNVDNLLLSSEEYREFYNSMKNDIIPRYKDKITIISSPRFMHLEKNPITNDSSKALDYRCSAGRLQCFCTAEGDIYPCYLFYDEKEYKVGNVFERSFDEIWKDPNSFGPFREKMGTISECEKCEYSQSCKGGCRGVAYKTTGDFFAADPYCWNLDK
jgi:KxxxW cyclic peptide radical SAM maturase